MGINNQNLIDKIYNNALLVYPITIDMAAQIAKYVDLLLKWNRVYNLTAITAIDEVIRLHILDGLSIMSHLHEFNNIIDVGSGMGVPGILIAIVYPQIKVSLIDNSSKKTSFLKQVAIELGLSNIVVINSRVEEYDSLIKFDVAISRAFTSSKMFIDLTAHLLKVNNSNWLLMKSTKIDSEIAQLADYKYDILNLNVKDIIGERYLLKIYNKVR